MHINPLDIIPGHRKQQSPLILIGKLFIAIGLLLGGIYITTASIQFINRSVNIKKQIAPIQEGVDLHYQMTKQLTQILSTTPTQSDAATISQNGQRLSSTLTQIQDLEESLDPLSLQLNTTRTQEYLRTYQNYRLSSDEITNSALAHARLFAVFSQTISEYEQLQVLLPGLNNLIYNNPERFQREASTIIAKERAIIAKLQSLEAPETLSNQLEQYINLLNSEVKLLEDLAAAASSRDQEAIATAQKQYALSQLKYSRELNQAVGHTQIQLDSLALNLDLSYQQLILTYASLSAVYVF
jgi:hypothetical protein